jgi:hypothetical protein
MKSGASQLVGLGGSSSSEEPAVCQGTGGGRVDVRRRNVECRSKVEESEQLGRGAEERAAWLPRGVPLSFSYHEGGEAEARLNESRKDESMWIGHVEVGGVRKYSEKVDPPCPTPRFFEYDILHR